MRGGANRWKHVLFPGPYPQNKVRGSHAPVNESVVTSTTYRNYSSLPIALSKQTSADPPSSPTDGSGARVPAS